MQNSLVPLNTLFWIKDANYDEDMNNFMKPFFVYFNLYIWNRFFDRFLIKECVLLSNPLLKSVLQRTVKQVAVVNIVMEKEMMLPQIK